MKLIECYIENFGKISAQRFEFGDGLNCISSDNGSGKTTLAAFIKVMLYGMSDTKKTSLEENDRKHYLPWNGGACGGSLTFSAKDKTYRIQRSFAARASDDKFTLYDKATGRECDDFSENLGAELFGIDADGFERTVFLSERSLAPKSENKTISAKLSDLVGCDGDIGEMDKALKNLENQRKFYFKKGGYGEIAEIKSRIAEVNRRLDTLSETEKALTSANKRLRQISEEINRTTDSLQELVKRREELTLIIGKDGYEERYRQMASRLDDMTAQRDRIFNLFDGRPPEFAEIDDAVYKATEAKKLSDITADEDNPSLRALCETFEGKTDGEEIERIGRKLARLREIKVARSSPEALRASELFARKTPAAEEIAEISSLQKAITGKKQISVYIISAIIFIVGVALGIIASPICYALSVVGVLVGTIYTITFSARNKRARKRIYDFFTSVYGKMPENGEATTELLSEMSTLVTIAERLTQNREAEEIEAELKEFADKFSDKHEDSLKECELILKNYSEFMAMSMADRYLKEGRRDAVLRAEGLKAEVASFIARFKIASTDPFSEMRSNLIELNRLNKDILSLTEQITEFKSKYDLGEDELRSAREELGKIEPNRREIEEKVEALRREYTLTERACRGYADELDSRDELSMRLSELEEARERYEENYEIILATKKYLTAACDSMTSRYIGKTKESFLKYTEIIGGGEQSGFEMDTDFGVSKIEGAATKTVEAYSRGTKDLYNLALRLALVDSLYEGEKPFIILDDPFIAFDDKKVGSALRLLTEFATDRQIIYFTCSSARSL